MTHKVVARGFSLTETLVVIAVLTTVGIALGSAIQYFYQANAYLFEAAVALENAQRGLNTSLNHIREAVSGEDGSYPLSSAATSSLTFHADIDLDNSVERVRYFMQAGTLYESVTNAAGNPPSYVGQSAATSTVIQYVRNGTSTPIFRFYDDTGAELSSPFDIGSVHAVGITIETDLNPQKLPNIYTLSGNASIRNIINQ